MLKNFICDYQEYSQYHFRKIRSSRLDSTWNKDYGFSSVECHTAMGVVEGYHSDNLIPWDVAAGVYNLIIKEAGGIVIEIQII